jgi:DNA-binding CsgD family transcriptional regulator
MPAPVILAGTYNGINFYNYQNGKFVNPSVHCHFESARYVAIENNIAWAAHPFKGLFKIQLNEGASPSYTFYRDRKNILSQKNQNHLFKVKSRIVLTNEKGFFEYNSKTDDFEPSSFFKNIFGSITAEYLREDKDGNIWFIENKRVGVVDFSGTKPQIVYFPELNNRIVSNGLEFIYPYNARNIFIAGEEGFYHLNYEQYKTVKTTTPILISTVAINNKTDSTIFGGYSNNSLLNGPVNSRVPNIHYPWNSIHFEFSSALYGKQASIEYSYYLEDFDKSWSPWSKKTDKEYTNLSPGTYTFKVKARTHEGKESAISSYQFTILPPWYRTWWAYLLYALITGSLIYSIYRWQKHKFSEQQRKHEEERKKLEYVNKLQKEKYEEEQKQLLYLHQLEIERNENEIMRLRNEKLESEIQLKNTELASTTMNLIQQGEMLVKVKEEFIRMKKVHEMDKDSEDYKKIIRMLGENKVKKNWEQFAVHFDKVHSDFLVSLKDRYPNLTPSELKLCAYLRLNLSSKEIAQIMNITIKSVELARHRLRKKLGIEPQVNLFNFLLNFHSEIK